jgi:hypothetical protein
VAQGRPFQAQLEDLALGGHGDPVVRASLAALPQQLADEVRTRRRPREASDAEPPMIRQHGMGSRCAC